MTTVKIAGKPNASAAASLEAVADWLYTHPGGRVIGVVELRHTERTEPAPDVEKDKTVSLGITMLELATLEQEDPLRKAARALFLTRTATGTLDVDGELELSKHWLEQTAGDLAQREAVRLRAGVRAWAEKAAAAFNTRNATDAELRHELDAVASGLLTLLTGRGVDVDD